MKCGHCDLIRVGLVEVDETTHPVCALRPDEHEVDEHGYTISATWLARVPTPQQNEKLNEYMASEAAKKAAEAEAHAD